MNYKTIFHSVSPYGKKVYGINELHRLCVLTCLPFHVYVSSDVRHLLCADYPNSRECEFFSGEERKVTKSVGCG